MAAPTVSAHDRRGPVITRLTEFGSDDFVTGSTIGPHRRRGRCGSAHRPPLRTSGPVCRRSAAEGVPGVDIGGPVDVAFAGRTAYVLATLVSGEIFGEPFGDPEPMNGLYRIEHDGSIKLVADLRQWSRENPPKPAFFVDTGVQFALEPYRGGFLVTDAQHNRVLWVDQGGSINDLATFGNVVPTGLETASGHLSQLGPIPHRPEDGRIVAVRPGRSRAR